MAAVYTISESYGGSEIRIEVERDVESVTIGDNTISAHQITAFIDEVEVISELGTTAAHPPIYFAIQDRILILLAILRNQIDSVDELDEIMADLGFSKGSEFVLDYAVTSSTVGHIEHDWTADTDFAALEIEQATLSDYSDATVLHEGALTAPIDDGGYTSGVTRYMRIRGQRSGEDWGPWTNKTIVVS